MKDEESQAESTAANSGNNGNKGRYKVWAIAGILILAFWSMFTGSVSLINSSINPLSSDHHHHLNSPLSEDLDILELEEREKLVRQLWNVYTHSTSIRLPKFWLEAFKAAYEDLVNDVSGVRDNAISEIAKLSVKSIDLDSSPDQGVAESPHDRSKSNSRVPCCKKG